MTSEQHRRRSAFALEYRRMATIPRDLSFVRDGVALPEWLRRLVDEDADQRAAAGRAIQAMNHALPSVQTELRDIEPLRFNYEQHAERLGQAIRDALAEPSFDTADFVRRLCALELAADRDWMRKCDAAAELRHKREAKYDRMAEKLVQHINSAPDGASREEATKRFMRLSRAYICGGEGETPQLTPGVIGGGVARLVVLKALRAESMLAPEAVESLLDNRRQRYQVLRLLRQAGTAAATFAPKLLSDVDAAAAAAQGDRTSVHYFGEDAAALAAIAQGNAGIIDTLIARLGGPRVLVRGMSAMTLKHMGKHVCGRNVAIIAALRPLLESDQTSHAAVAALASVGRDDRSVRQLIIDRARPAPPRMMRPPDFPQYEYDATMVTRGTAIDAMVFFVDFPDDCLPTLIDAIDTFVEFDPDESYGGPCARVATALGRFGVSAGPAATVLAKHLDDAEGDYPRDILNALAAMGPAARDALPLLESYRAQRGGPTADQTPPDRDVDPLGWIISELRRVH
jgi:hypothetical protein